MKTPDQKPSPSFSKEKIKKEYLDQGYIDASKVYGIELMEKLPWRKKITAVFIGGDTPEIYSNLELGEFHDVRGYGFRLPKGHILLIIKYQTDPKDLDLGKPLQDWLFKVE